MQHPPPPGVCTTGCFFSSAGLICGSWAFPIGSGGKIGGFLFCSPGLGFVPGTGDDAGAPGIGDDAGAPGIGDVCGTEGARAEGGVKGLLNPSPGSGFIDGPVLG